MDYPSQAWLKMRGRARIMAPADAPRVIAAMTDPKLISRVERGIAIDVEADDWNCQQHITQRYTAEDLAPVILRYEARIKALELVINGQGAG